MYLLIYQKVKLNLKKKTYVGHYKFGNTVERRINDGLWCFIFKKMGFKVFFDGCSLLIRFLLQRNDESFDVLLLSRPEPGVVTEVSF